MVVRSHTNCKVGRNVLRRMETRLIQATLIIEVSPVMFANEISHVALYSNFFVVAAAHSVQCIAPYNFDERYRKIN